MDNLLSINNLNIKLNDRNNNIHLIKNFSLEINKGETVGIIGESGCGKSISMLSILGLFPNPLLDSGRKISIDGSFYFDGKNLTFSKNILKDNNIGIIFQNPMNSLNPTMRIGKQVSESVMKHRNLSKKNAKLITLDLLNKVELPDFAERYNSYPFELSGGMRQRIMIAIALAGNPRLLIADEPTTSLDVTVQSQIIQLLKNLVKEYNLSIILITHNLGVAAGICDKIVVMYYGRILESGKSIDIFNSPKHPYTIGLLNSIHKINDEKHKELFSINGVPPDMTKKIDGCCFYKRCDSFIDGCEKYKHNLKNKSNNHSIDCNLY